MSKDNSIVDQPSLEPALKKAVDVDAEADNHCQHQQDEVAKASPNKHRLQYIVDNFGDASTREGPTSAPTSAPAPSAASSTAAATALTSYSVATRKKSSPFLKQALGGFSQLSNFKKHNGPIVDQPDPHLPATKRILERDDNKSPASAQKKARKAKSPASPTAAKSTDAEKPATLKLDALKLALELPDQGKRTKKTAPSS
ncbi:hypothetical protein ACHAQA_003279 [Verticillium albo-atrum]